MQDSINCNRVKVSSFSTEIPVEIDKEKRLYILTECEVYETSLRDNNDGSFDKIFKVKACGSTQIKQDGLKEPIIGKSKRSQSARLRAKVWSLNPEEEFYEMIMDKLIINAEEIIEFLKDK